MIKVVLETDIAGFDLQQALAEISPERREKALKFRHEQGQRECVLAYLLLKRGLKELYNIDENPIILELEGGKPILKDHPDIHFNLSHCKEAVVCAIGDEPVGVDVETIRPYKEALARHVLNEEELAEVQSSKFKVQSSKFNTPSSLFTELWTKKEALLKLTGHGIREDLKTVLPNPKVKFETIKEERFIYTIATHAPILNS